jgi:hypothetical protein
MRYGFPDLTARQVASLEAYRREHGRTWKATLRQIWMEGGAHIRHDDDVAHVVYALRNSHGPTWLIAYRPEPTEQEIAAARGRGLTVGGVRVR